MIPFAQPLRRVRWAEMAKRRIQTLTWASCQYPPSVVGLLNVREQTVSGPWADRERTVSGPWADRERTVSELWAGKWFKRLRAAHTVFCVDLITAIISSVHHYLTDWLIGWWKFIVRIYFNTCTMHLSLFCIMTNKCTIISQIITLIYVSTISCHPQGACNQ